MATSSTLTFRISAEMRERLDRLARATQRSRSWLAADAIGAYLELQEWQIAETEAGIREADAGEFATQAEVDKFFNKWKRRAPR